MLAPMRFIFGGVHESLGENGVFDDAESRGGRKKGAHLGLHVGGEAGVGLGRDVGPDGIFGATDGDGVVRRSQVPQTAGFEDLSDAREVLGVDALEGDFVFGGHGSGDEKGSGLDAVRNDGVLDAAELVDAFDLDAGRSGSGNFCAHGVEKVSEVDDFGFAGGSGDDGGAFGENGGHHDVVGAEHGGSVFSGHVDGVSDEAATGFEVDVSAVDGDGGSEAFESFEVEVNGTVADDAASGQGDVGAVLTGEEGTHDAGRMRRIFPNEVVGGLVGANFLALDDDVAAGALDFGSEILQDLQHVVGVGDIGDASDDALFAGE